MVGTFTKDNGEVVGREYVRDRVRRRLARHSAVRTAEERTAALAETVDCDAWLLPRSGCTVASLEREAEMHLLSSPHLPGPAPALPTSGER